jgi:rod shape-determining protein MreC
MRRAGILILVLVGISLVLIVVDQVAGLGLIKGALGWVLAPLQHGLNKGGGEAADFWERLRECERLQEENEQLREMVDFLTAENIGYQECKRERDELRELLGLGDRYPNLELLYAEVIGRDPGGLRQTLRVGWAPREDRAIVVREGMPVVSAAGLVGQVVQVYPNAADVLLITDINSRVSARIQNQDRPTGVVDGQWQAGTRLLMRFIPQGAVVNEDDWVVTSGLQLPPFEDKAFPPDIPVGKVLQVEFAADMHQQAELLPAVDFDRLERVMIVLGTR